jgi:chromate reductase
MNPFMAHVISGPEVMLANSSDAFDENGHLTNERTVAGIEKLMAKLRPS